MINMILNIIVVLVVGFILDYSYTNLRKENKILRKDVDELQYKLDNSDVIQKCDDILKEFNEIMFGSPPLENKVIIVRGIKEYDYTSYKKDINELNEYLGKGWSIVKHENNEFVHTYIIGKPLVWKERGDINGE